MKEIHRSKFGVRPDITKTQIIEGEMIYKFSEHNILADIFALTPSLKQTIKAIIEQ